MGETATCHPERSKCSGGSFAESNHPLGWCPQGRIYEKFSIAPIKYHRSRLMAPSLWSGSTSKTSSYDVFSAQDDSGGSFTAIYNFIPSVKPKFDENETNAPNQAVIPPVNQGYKTQTTEETSKTPTDEGNP